MKIDIVDVFTSKECRFLRWLDTMQMDTSNGRMVIFPQEELAKQYGCSVATVNGWIQALKKAKCVEVYKKKSGYIVTQTGNDVLAQIEKINNIIGGKTHGN